jgi:hypothetical protein
MTQTGSSDRGMSAVRPAPGLTRAYQRAAPSSWGAMMNSARASRCSPGSSETGGAVWPRGAVLRGPGYRPGSRTVGGGA